MTNPNDDEEHRAYLDELANDDPAIFVHELITDLMPPPANLEEEVARALNELDHQQVRLKMSDEAQHALAMEIAKQRTQVAGARSIQTEALKDESRRETRKNRAETPPEQQLKDGYKRAVVSDENRKEWANHAVSEWRKNPRQSARQLARAIVERYKPQMFDQIYKVVLAAINVEKCRTRKP